MFWFNTTCYFVNLQSMMHNIHIFWQNFCYLLVFLVPPTKCMSSLLTKTSVTMKNCSEHFVWWKKQISLSFFFEEVKFNREKNWFFKYLMWLKKKFLTNSHDPPRIVAPKNFKNIWLFNLLALRVPDEGYSRNVLCTLNLISKFLILQMIYVVSKFVCNILLLRDLYIC